MQNDLKMPPHESQLPRDFVLGAATAAYQIEGDAFGRGPAIWDSFARRPGAILTGENADTAVEHVDRLENDLDLMGQLHLDAYRFSVSWPRVFPAGSGKVNTAGLDFYDRLVDGLIARGIDPMVTLYHWDLPQAIETEGGWLNRDTVARFTDYAAVVEERLGDRVRNWVTVNEPWCSAFLGYGSGEHAPGVNGSADALRAAHHLNLAHGHATSVLRSRREGSHRPSAGLNLYAPEAVGHHGDAAARTVELLGNEIFLGPMLDGMYSDELISLTEGASDWAFVADGDLATIRQPLEWLGVNYYTTQRVSEGGGDPTVAAAWAGTANLEFLPPVEPTTEMGWAVDPHGLERVLGSLSRRYPDLDLVITENGAAFEDQVSPDGTIHDTARIEYLDAHLRSAINAIAQGVRLRGYFAWSLFDNFEWTFGYSKRFGLVYIDYVTQQRIMKDSARWFSRLLSSRRLSPLP